MVMKIYLVLLMNFAIRLFEIVEIPEIINDYCPYADFCDRKSQKSDSNKSCCASCACDPKCGLRRNCCFDELDNYKLMENGFIGCFSVTQGVKSLLIGTTENYYMVNSCNIEKIVENGTNRTLNIPDTSCMFNENGNMQMEPVSSKKTGWIYFNSKCAECNGVFEYSAWHFFSRGSLLLGNEIDKAETKFWVPPENERWTNQLCRINSKDPVVNCTESSLWYPLCKNLNSTFRVDKIKYRNVFCAVCMGLVIPETCSPEFIIVSNLASFTVLVDIRIVEMSRKVQMPEVCSHRMFSPQQPICHLVLCPEGMTYTPEGCRYHITRWNIYDYLVQIRLIPAKGNDLSIGTLRALNDSELLSTCLKVPCANATKFKSVIYNEISENADENIKSIIVQLFGYQRWADLEVLVSELRLCIENQWIILINTTQYSFDAFLDKYSGYIQDGIQKLQKVTYTNITEEKEIAKPKKYEKLTNNSSKSVSSLNKIGKLFFCKQVHVSAEEVEIGYGEIRILTSNITLGNNEFGVEDKTSFGGTGEKIFAVCLEDYIPMNTACLAVLLLDTYSLVVCCIMFLFV